MDFLGMLEGMPPVSRARVAPRDFIESCLLTSVHFSFISKLLCLPKSGLFRSPFQRVNKLRAHPGRKGRKRCEVEKEQVHTATEVRGGGQARAQLMVRVLESLLALGFVNRSRAGNGHCHIHY